MNIVSYQSNLPSMAVASEEGIVLEGGPKGMPLELTCRWPKDSEPIGFVVFCHGLGSSRRQFAELTESWSAQGYLTVMPTFEDSIGSVAATEPDLGIDPAEAETLNWVSDKKILARMFEILHSPRYWISRIDAVRLVIDQMEFILESTSGVPSNIIPCGVGGHSFGAYTSQLLGGVTIDLAEGGATQFRDPRVKAVALLSAQGRDQQGLRDGSWDTLACPMINITGTLDQGAKDQGVEWKREPYELAPNGNRYLAVLEAGDHTLGGLPRLGRANDNAYQRAAVAQLTLAFWDAHLLGDADAKSWLTSITDRVGKCPMTFEWK
jgi:hypothetical protein